MFGGGLGLRGAGARRPQARLAAVGRCRGRMTLIDGMRGLVGGEEVRMEGLFVSFELGMTYHLASRRRSSLVQAWPPDRQL